MALIKSISGIRGTIGGKPGEGLTPADVVKFSAAYGTWLQHRHKCKTVKVITGRDARRSGPIVSSLVINTLRSLGITVTDLGMATTPTVELAVTGTSAHGGIIVTASHNPAEWNALKLLNENGEFLSAKDGSEVLQIAEADDFDFAPEDKLGELSQDDQWGERHIEQIMKLSLVDVEKIKAARFSVAIDCVNSVGGLVVPGLLRSLGVAKIYELNTVADGFFAHNPEPLPQNLTDISDLVKKKKADIGFVVDPDVDRLAIICEDGSMFGEEYTLVAVSDYILKHTPGSTVSNLSSTRALKDVTESYGCQYFSAAVGEVNVVEEMKIRNAVIGGEGNGGIIYPPLHYGRDALAGIALFLSHLAFSNMCCSDLRNKYPDYWITKKKFNLEAGQDFDLILNEIRKQYSGHEIDERDGLRIEHKEGWVQIRKSNTEPVLRIYAEGRTADKAEYLSACIIEIVKKI